MKNKILSLLSLVLIIGVTACTKTEYVDRGDAIENPNVAFIVNIAPQDWQRVSPALLQFDLPLRDLTDYYILQGGVAVALSFDGEDSYDILPSTFEGLAYSVNYTTGWVTISIDDPLADDGVNVGAPTGDVVAKIILSSTDYLDYTGFFNSPSNQFDFKPLSLDSSK